MKRFSESISSINTIFLKGAGIMLLLTMAEAVANMVLRPLGHPVQGSFELMGFGAAVVAALGLANSQEKKVHICVDIIYGRFPKGIRRVLAGIGNLLCALFFAMAGWRIATLALRLWASGEVSETLRIPYYPFTAVVALGFWALSLTLFIDFLTGLGPERNKA